MRRDRQHRGPHDPLRLIRALPEAQTGPLQVIGVDERAYRKGRNYGTIIVDMATRRPVDLLPEATSDAFADGARRGAPEAIHAVDRWHLLANLSAVVERVVSRNRAYLQEHRTTGSGCCPPPTQIPPTVCWRNGSPCGSRRSRRWSPGAGPSAQSLENSSSIGRRFVATPALLDVTGISHNSAAVLITEIGDITQFVTSAKLARYTGCAPIPVYSADDERHRLHRSGNQRLNSVLYTAAMKNADTHPRRRS